MTALIESLIKEGWLENPGIIKAFKEAKRKDFLPKDMRHLSELDEALPIGDGQTISQPLVVAFMIEQLKPKPGDKILDIGSGSGWTTALLSHIVGSRGKVIAIELVPELKEAGERNAAKYVKNRAEFICADGSKGYKKEAPFDGILVSASAGKISKAWKDQLKVGGKIVAPIKHSIWVIKKKSEKEFKEKEYSGFVFVPLIIKK